MSRTIQRVDVESALEAAGIYDHESAIKEGYQGRGYAKPGFAVVCGSVKQMFPFFVALGYLACENEDCGSVDVLTDGDTYDLASSASYDNFSNDVIVSFPGWTLL